MPFRINSQLCTVLDLGDAGARLVRLLDDANRRHDHQNVAGHRMPQYGVAGLAAVGVWVNELNDEGKAHRLATSVLVPTPRAAIRVAPVFPEQREGSSLSEEEQRGIVRRDQLEVEWQHQGIQSPHTFFFTIPRAETGQADVSPGFNVFLNTTGAMLSPNARDFHTYFTRLSARHHSELLVQSGPFLLYGGVNFIRLMREQQVSVGGPGRAWDNYVTVLVLELLCLVLVSHLCAQHGSHSMHLGAEDWRTFVGSLDSGRYRLAQSFVAAGGLREDGRTAREAANWVLAQQARHGGDAEPASAEQERELAEEIDEALRWVEGFFYIAPGLLLASRGSIQLRTLGKSASPYDPQDRRLSAQF